VTRVSDERALWLARYVLPHEPSLRAWLQGRQPAGLEVDDIVQETYARLIAVESVAQVRNVKAYAFQTAHSVMASHVRRAKVVSFQHVSDMDQLGVAAGEAGPEAQAIGHQELQRLARAIARLPAKVRRVFMLRRIDGLSQRDVARRLGLSESTVEKHMGRALLLLLESFGQSERHDPRAPRRAAQAETGHGQAKQSRD
jgi:RNA polymerase sigma factor (sigma-70 family)